MISKIKSDLTAAQKARDELKVSTLRLLLSSLHNEEIVKHHELSDDEIQQVIAREIKRRKEAADAYSSAGRNDAAATEQSELELLMSYAPAQLTELEIKNIVDRIADELGSTETNKIMGRVMQEIKGRADGTQVRHIVEQLTK